MIAKTVLFEIATKSVKQIDFGSTDESTYVNQSSFLSPYRALMLAGSLLVGGVQNGFAQNPLATADKFNVFLATDATLKTNESDGAVALAGNLTVDGNYQVATHGSAVTFKVGNYPVGLVVGGGVKLKSGTLQVNGNTYAKIGACAGNSATDALKVWYQDNNNAYSTIRITKSGDGYSSTPNILINQQANQALRDADFICGSTDVDFVNSFATLKSNSLKLSQNADRVKLTNANGGSISSTNPPSQVKISLYAGINVLNIKGTDLNQIQNLTYSDAPASGRVLVINVDAAGSFTWNTPSLGGVGGSNAPYILWNFYNTTQLTIGGNSTIEGSMLAPLANVVKTSNSSNIEGQLIANSFVHSGGEMHHFPFDADLGMLLSEDPAPAILTISGSVLNDVNGLTDGIVNGTPVNSLKGNTFYTSLIDAAGKVVASTALTNGTYSFTVSTNTSYSVVLSNAPALVGSAPPSTTLTGSVVNSGENIGTGAGSDGTPNGIIAVPVASNSITDANFGVRAMPDLTPIIYATPSTVAGTTPINVVVDVVEVNSVATSGLITVYVTKDPRTSLNFSPGETMVGIKQVQNSVWTFDGTSNAMYYILKTTQVVTAGDKLTFGLTGKLTPGATKGQLTISTVIGGGSGSEVRVTNNSDAEKIDYFIN